MMLVLYFFTTESSVKCYHCNSYSDYDDDGKPCKWVSFLFFMPGVCACVCGFGLGDDYDDDDGLERCITYYTVVKIYI